MPIQNINGSVAQAPQPSRHTSDSAPNFVAAGNSNSEVIPGTQADLPRVAVRQVAEQQPTAPQLQSVVDNINKALQQSNKNLQFSIDTDTKKSVVKLVDTETGDVIRQFPSEEAIAISKSIDQIQQGLLLKLKA
jgi:flagellar protein FlaG